MKNLNLKLVLIIVFSMLFGANHSVIAEQIIEPTKVLDYNVLNSYSETIEFTSDNFAIVKGSLVNKLLVPYVISQINVDGLIVDYAVEEVKIIDDEILLEDTDVVLNGMKLVFGEDNVYNIIVVGDMNDDAIVNNDDVSVMFEQLLFDGEVGPLNDINNDGVFNNLDITYTVYSIFNSSWVNDTVVNDSLISDFLISKENIYENDEFEVKYIVKGFEKDFINGFEGNLVYDNEYLQYISYEIDSKYKSFYQGGKFGFILDNYISEEISEEVIVTFKFKAIKEGNTKIEFSKISTSMNGVMMYLDKDMVSCDVSINNDGIRGDAGINPDGNIQEPNDEVVDTSTNNGVITDTPVTNLIVRPVINNPIISVEDKSNSEVLTVVSLSSDSFINSLKIDGYEIDFDKAKYDYNISVPYDINSLDLEIVLSDSDASYEIFGNDSFKVGKNVVSIVVTALDGSNSTYTINVNKEEKVLEEESVEEETSNSSRVVIIILIILVIIGLIYVIFKDDEEDEK